jgi:membrane protein YdbS with pleckstrin-like domain
MPQIRKITRVGFLIIHITFLNILFTGLNYLIQPYVSTSPNFANSSRIAAIVMIVVVLVSSIGIIFHYYKTYNSDVLEHYYTLR